MVEIGDMVILNLSTEVTYLLPYYVREVMNSKHTINKYEVIHKENRNIDVFIMVKNRFNANMSTFWVPEIYIEKDIEYYRNLNINTLLNE